MAVFWVGGDIGVVDTYEICREFAAEVDGDGDRIVADLTDAVSMAIELNQISRLLTFCDEGEGALELCVVRRVGNVQVEEHLHPPRPSSPGTIWNPLSRRQQ